jgi:hypothetical protein
MRCKPVQSNDKVDKVLTHSGSIQPPDHLRFKGSLIARTLIKWIGWRINWGGLPASHGVIVVYPHTSNWDFVIGILAKWAIGIPLQFWGKSSLFTGIAKFTIGPLIRYWGGIPVNRHASNGVIDDTLKQMQTTDYCWLALAPEGTRSYSLYWRSGFYRVALAAQCPLGLAYFDFKNKIVGITEFIALTGDETLDIATIRHYYEGKAYGYTPEKAGAINLKKHSTYEQSSI